MTFRLRRAVFYQCYGKGKNQFIGILARKLVDNGKKYDEQR